MRIGCPKVVVGLLFSGFLWGVLPVCAQRSVTHGVRTALRGPQVATYLQKQIAMQRLQSVSKAEKVIYHATAVNQGVFCAHAALGKDAFSGGVFQVTHQGKKEIFGFIAAHSLADVPSSLSERLENQYYLSRSFALEMQDKEGRRHTVMAEVVGLSSPKMLDIALVKFRPEDEKLFKPFLLRQEPLRDAEKLEFRGFSDKGAALFPRKLLAQTPISLRTDMIWPRMERVGFCGGVLLDGQEQLVGVHTGSTHGLFQGKDIGYATHAKFLRVLVDAYHRPGKATFPLELGGQKTIDLAPDEYVTAIDFFDRKGEKVGVYWLDFKFSYSEVEEIIKMRNPRYLRFTIGRLEWSAAEPEYVEETASKRKVVYDLKRKRVISKELER